MPAAHLRISIPPRPHISSASHVYSSTFRTLTKHLQTSILYVNAPTAHLQRSRASCLHASMTQHVWRDSSALEFHTSTSARLPLPSRAPELHISRLPRLHTYCALQALHASIPLRRYAYLASPGLQISKPPHLHVCSLPPVLQHSMPPHRYVCIDPPALLTSVPPRLHTHNTSTDTPHFHAGTPALHTSRAPYMLPRRYAYSPTPDL